MYTKKHEFWHDELCLDLVDSDPSTKAMLYDCHCLGGNQKWEHDRVRKAKLRYATVLHVSFILSKHWRTVFPNTDRQDSSVKFLLFCVTLKISLSAMSMLQKKNSRSLEMVTDYWHDLKIFLDMVSVQINHSDFVKVVLK